jgi:hypothetical protein
MLGQRFFSVIRTFISKEVYPADILSEEKNRRVALERAVSCQHRLLHGPHFIAARLKRVK